MLLATLTIIAPAIGRMPLPPVVKFTAPMVAVVTCMAVDHAIGAFIRFFCGAASALTSQPRCAWRSVLRPRGHDSLTGYSPDLAKPHARQADDASVRGNPNENGKCRSSRQRVTRRWRYSRLALEPARSTPDALQGRPQVAEGALAVRRRSWDRIRSTHSLHNLGRTCTRRYTFGPR